VTLYNAVVIIIVLAIFVSYLNYRFLKMQPTMAIMATSLILSLALLVSEKLGLSVVHKDVIHFVDQLHFHDILMNCMLGALLFAGSLTVDIHHLKKQRWEIGVLATGSIIASTFIIGAGMYYLLMIFNVHVNFVYCLLFGSLISPTDPIAVLATFKQSKAPKKLEILLAGESLFNDGVGVVLFVSLYHVAFSGEPISFSATALLFVNQALGGLAFGLILGLLSHALMKPVNNHKIEILLTIALVTGGYSLAQTIGVSGPLAMVASGIYIASNKHKIFRSKSTQEYLETFWELIDELLNSVLFLLIGFEILIVHFAYWQAIASIIAIFLVLLSRLLTVAIPMRFAKYLRKYPPYTVRILTWGGLRGGLAVALALSIPSGEINNIFLPITYAVVLFSILIQGTTIKTLVLKSKAVTVMGMQGEK
jgi:monovalent cation:H+ antiporter, CPA1 family